MKKKNVNKFIYWAPRILSILFILFLMMFSLDIFDMKLNFWGTLLGLFMHNIPAFILIAVLVIAWKHELVGAIAFAVAGLLYILRTTITIINSGMPRWIILSWSLTIAGPAFLVGILFLINWLKKKKGYTSH